jgi:hypothetical protein
MASMVFITIHRNANDGLAPRIRALSIANRERSRGIEAGRTGYCHAVAGFAIVEVRSLQEGVVKSARLWWAGRFCVSMNWVKQ